MSNSDFEDRLSRIKANGGQQTSAATANSGKNRSFLSGIILGAVTVTAGAQLIKVTNANYDSIRDQYGIPAAVGLGLGSLALVVLGIVIFIRALFSRRSAAAGQSALPYAASGPRPQAQTSAGARLFFSLLGLGLGGLAALFMYIGNAAFQLSVAGQISVETSRAMATGSSIAAGFLGVLALLIGFIGLFIRGLPMKRVPVYFLLGAVLLFATFQTLGIHPANWPTFMAEFTRSFTNQTAE